MKKIILSALIIGSMISCTQNEKTKIINNSNTEIMDKQEKQKIEELLRTYQKCLNTSDAKLAQQLYTKDGVFMPTQAPTGSGSEGILKSYEWVFSNIQLTIEFSIEEIQVEGNMAFAITSSNGTVKVLATGDVAPEANRELFVFEKVEGEWKIARYMFNKTK